MSDRMWIGSAGGELLGFDALGNPVLGNEEGVESMTPLHGVVLGPFTLSNDETAPQSED